MNKPPTGQSGVSEHEMKYGDLNGGLNEEKINNGSCALNGGEEIVPLKAYAKGNGFEFEFKVLQKGCRAQRTPR